MRHQPIDVGGSHVGHRERFVTHVGHHVHRHFEHGRPVHVDMWITVDDAVSHMTRHVENIAAAAVGMQLGGENSRAQRLRQNDRTRAIAEQHAGGAIFPIEDA